MSDILSKAEAEAEVERLNKMEPDWFCPLIKDVCIKKCVCFVNAKVHVHTTKHLGTTYYNVQELHCNNAMFSEYRHIINGF